MNPRFKLKILEKILYAEQEFQKKGQKSLYFFVKMIKEKKIISSINLSPSQDGHFGANKRKMKFRKLLEWLKNQIVCVQED